jgi:predicted DNA-binding transcriptional regulator YafY
MKDNTPKRLSRLTAILTQLQTKRLITSTSLAEKFKVSVRTIYRDMKALEQAGVPVLSEEGRGYLLMEGYRIPPVMFTENEANALITAEQLVLKNKDTSLRKEYSEAINKIRAVLKTSTKEKAELLSKRIVVRPQVVHKNPSDTLSKIQIALTEFRLVKLRYYSGSKQKTTRNIEPFALYNNTQEDWNLIAFCRLRKDFRLFRLDRILSIEILEKQFEPHKITLEQYIENARKKHFNTPDKRLS